MTVIYCNYIWCFMCFIFLVALSSNTTYMSVCVPPPMTPLISIDLHQSQSCGLS